MVLGIGVSQAANSRFYRAWRLDTVGISGILAAGRFLGRIANPMSISR
jgi:hypothetical protein